MSAANKPEVIDQLAHSLAPHQVLVQHDFSRLADFHLTADNVSFVPKPSHAGWAFSSFTDAVFHALQHALSHLEFDYLQLLSARCLPIKSLDQFESHVSGAEDAHFDCIDLSRDRDALMSVGYRAYTPEKSIRHRVARRLSSAYFGASLGQRDEAGVRLRSGGRRALVSLAAVLANKALSHPAIGRHVFDHAFRPYYGSVWFGARSHVVSQMVEAYLRPGIRAYFNRLHRAEDFLIPTLLMHTRPNKGPMNHCVQIAHQAQPDGFDETQLEQLRQSPAYFARRFPGNPEAPVRIKVLRELAAVQGRSIDMTAAAHGHSRHRAARTIV